GWRSLPTPRRRPSRWCCWRCRLRCSRRLTCWNAGADAMPPDAIALEPQPPPTTLPAAERRSSATESRTTLRATRDPAWVRWTLTSTAIAIIVVLVVVPVVHVFWMALGKGIGAYFHSLFGDRDTRNAILLTLTV